MSWTGHLISARRNALGLTQAQLAERVGASLRAVTSWEADASQPQKKFRAALEQVLGSPLAASADPARRVDLARLNNSQIVALIAEIAAEVGYRLESASDEERPPRALPTDETTARRGRYYPVGHNASDDPDTAYARYDPRDSESRRAVERRRPDAG